jgi:hypothetical protein
MPHQIYLWYGYPVRLEKFIGHIAGRSYWWVTTLYTPTPELMVIVKTEP